MKKLLTLILLLTTTQLYSTETYKLKLNKEAENSFKILKDAIKNGTIKKDKSENMIKELLEKNLLSNEEIAKMLEAHTLKQEVISVDSFDAEVYKTKR